MEQYDAHFQHSLVTPPHPEVEVDIFYRLDRNEPTMSTEDVIFALGLDPKSATVSAIIPNYVADLVITLKRQSLKYRRSRVSHLKKLASSPDPAKVIAHADRLKGNERFLKPLRDQFETEYGRPAESWEIEDFCKVEAERNLIRREHPLYGIEKRYYDGIASGRTSVYVLQNRLACQEGDDEPMRPFRAAFDKFERVRKQASPLWHFVQKGAAQIFRLGQIEGEDGFTGIGLYQDATLIVIPLELYQRALRTKVELTHHVIPALPRRSYHIERLPDTTRPSDDVPATSSPVEPPADDEPEAPRSEESSNSVDGTEVPLLH
ncbi:MAG: hypothetical protein WC787_04060 [Patescibacteria group bacterium]|jgi:hypothetical protein